MADETMLLDSVDLQAQEQAGAAQEKSRKKGVQGEAKPTRDAENKDAKTPPAKAIVPTRTESFVFGIPQNGLEHRERKVPLDEPPPLAANADLKYIGKPTERYDGPAKATGKGKYTADVHLPGMLFGRMVDASIPHGKIVSVDTSAAEKLPGVRAVYVIEHVMGSAELRDPKLETPSRYPIIRYAGQPIAGVAATSQVIADDAAALVKVNYEAMPFVVDGGKAREKDSPKVFPGAADEGGSAGGGGGPKGVPQVGNVHGPRDEKGRRHGEGNGRGGRDCGG